MPDAATSGETLRMHRRHDQQAKAKPGVYESVQRTAYGAYHFRTGYASTFNV
nr:MAG TPA: hypothetical protein [Caudoviricetes sp.]